MCSWDHILKASGLSSRRQYKVKVGNTFPENSGMAIYMQKKCDRLGHTWTLFIIWVILLQCESTHNLVFVNYCHVKIYWLNFLHDKGSLFSLPAGLPSKHLFKLQHLSTQQNAEQGLASWMASSRASQYFFHRRCGVITSAGDHSLPFVLFAAQ